MLPQPHNPSAPDSSLPGPSGSAGCPPDQPSNPGYLRCMMAGGRPHHRFLLRSTSGTNHTSWPPAADIRAASMATSSSTRNLTRPDAQFPFFVLSCACVHAATPTPPTVRFRLMVHPPAIGAFVYSVETRLFRTSLSLVSERGHFEAAVFSLLFAACTLARAADQSRRPLLQRPTGPPV